MITGFEEYTKELTTTEKELLSYVVEWLNEEDSWITNDQLGALSVAKLNWSPGSPRIRKIINVIRRAGIIPCLIATSKGYKRARTNYEMVDYIKSLDERVSSIQAIRAALAKQYHETTGLQLSLL